MKKILTLLFLSACGMDDTATMTSYIGVNQHCGKFKDVVTTMAEGCPGHIIVVNYDVIDGYTVDCFMEDK